MKKILILTNHSYMLYRFRLELIQALGREHEVVLCMPFVGHEADFRTLGFRCVETPVDRRGMDPRKDFPLFQTYRRLLAQEKPDLVLTYSIKPNIYGGIACTLAGIPYCAYVQGLGTAFQKPVLAGVVTVLYKLALAKAKRVFFENQANAGEFCRRGIQKPDRQTVLSGAGINLQAYPRMPYPREEPVRFLYLGRIMGEKGMDELFFAIEKLAREMPGRFRLDLVGFFEEGYKARVEELCRRGLVVYHGFQEDPRPYYAACHCLVLPSYHEGMSNVLLEAAATGRPLITSDIPGCREAVEPGVSGLLCPPRDGEALYCRMREMLRLPPEAREEMGRRGRAWMEARFSRAQVVEQTCQALEPWL